MKEVVLLFSMIFLHIADDFYLQGILGSLKQKSWWKENYPDKLYKNDYIIALILHSFSWTFMINIPVVIYSYSKMDTISFVIMFFINMIIHCIVDDTKANMLLINLTTDQCIHLAQILFLWILIILV